MKTVHSRRADAYTVTVPVRGGYSVSFTAGRATVPDDVSEVLVAIGGGFYTLLGETVSLAAGSRVLVVRDMGLGDVLLITPLLRLLARRGCHVDVQTHGRYVPLLEGNPHVQQVFSLERDTAAAASYDAVLDLRRFVENEELAGSHAHRVDGFAGAAEVPVSESEHHLDFFLTDAEADAGIGRIAPLESSGVRGTVAYVWRASAGNRSWTAHTHLQMLNALQQAGWGVALLDAQPQDTTGSHLLNLTGQLSIRETAAVMAAADVVLTPDTGLFHLAGALNKPTVAYFGAFPAEERQTHRKLTVLDNRAACARFPCRSYTCFNHEAGQSRCLSVSPQSVLEALEAVVAAPPPKNARRASRRLSPKGPRLVEASHAAVLE